MKPLCSCDLAPWVNQAGDILESEGASLETPLQFEPAMKLMKQKVLQKFAVMLVRKPGAWFVCWQNPKTGKDAGFEAFEV